MPGADGRSGAVVAAEPVAPDLPADAGPDRQEPGTVPDAVLGDPRLSVPGGRMTPCGTRSTFRTSGSSRRRRSSPRGPAGPRRPAGTRGGWGLTLPGRKDCAGEEAIPGY